MPKFILTIFCITIIIAKTHQNSPEAKMKIGVSATPYIDTLCPVCNGTGKKVSTPPDINSPEYPDWISGKQELSAAPCKKCASTGTLKTVNKDWLVKVRETAGLSRKEMSERLGVSYGYVVNLENGYANCTPQLLERYSNITKTI